MLVYRCIGNSEKNAIIENKQIYSASRRRNMTDYSCQGVCEYKHFFLFAESAQIYRSETYGMISVIQCDIPYEILSKHKRIGYYGGVIEGCRIPMPEFAVPIESVRFEYIKDISDDVKPEWERPDDYIEYLESIPENLKAPPNICRSELDYYLSSAYKADLHKRMVKK
jgi:hypothetical protein